jgi:hypothetical protein
VRRPHGWRSREPGLRLDVHVHRNVSVRSEYCGDGEYMSHFGRAVSLDVDVCAEEVEGACYVHPRLGAMGAVGGNRGCWCV